MYAVQYAKNEYYMSIDDAMRAGSDICPSE